MVALWGRVGRHSLRVQGMLGARLSASLYPERMSVCLFLSVTWTVGGRTSQKSILLSGEGGLGTGLLLWSSAASLVCAWGAPSAAVGAATGAAFLGECPEDPRDEIAAWPVLHGCGQALLAVQLSGVHRGRPQPPCFPPPRAIQILHSLCGTGTSRLLCCKRGDALPCS